MRFLNLGQRESFSTFEQMYGASRRYYFLLFFDGIFVFLFYFIFFVSLENKIFGD